MNNQLFNEQNQPQGSGNFYGQGIPVRPKTPVEIETENLKRISKSHGGIFLLQMAIAVIIIFLITIILIVYLLSTIDISTFDPFSGLQDVLNRNLDKIFVLSLVTTIIGSVASILWYYRKQKGWLKELIKPEESDIKYSLNFKSIFLMSLFTLGLNSIFGVIAYFFSYIMSLFGGDLSATYIVNSLDNIGGFGKIFFVMYTVICAPIIEEILFRGVILKPLRRYGDTFAIVLSAAIFSIMHGNLIQIPSAFAIGLLFAYITVRSNSILPAIILHFINNLFAIIETFLPNIFSGRSLEIVNIVFLSITVITVIYSVVKIITYKKWLSVKNIEEIPKIYQPKNKVRTYIFTPLMIILLVFIMFTIVTQTTALLVAS